MTLRQRQGIWTARQAAAMRRRVRASLAGKFARGAVHGAVAAPSVLERLAASLAPVEVQGELVTRPNGAPGVNWYFRAPAPRPGPPKN